MAKTEPRIKAVWLLIVGRRVKNNVISVYSKNYHKNSFNLSEI